MPTCEDCQKKWSYGDTFKIPFTMEEGKPCPHCGAAQYVTSKTRSRAFLLTFFALILIFTLNFWLGFSIVNLLIALFIIPLYIVIYPFLVDLSSHPEEDE